ncbi:carbohydrate ABC transporter permease [Marinilactibacillus psychrotolerans]|uniref:Carbohydrate ABC transporter permease n=2 Tax=Marinilactibacillus psychrotolerans TaxID=191770 RepID=A0A511H329_9LACT|nr:carbohydrate ABC transporter permease [Marinilactibacillus psychrotolerans]TLQ07273.1 carbohydrate ABC transporter permease [Marinilactibacillus psychrotolerans]SDD26697.1 raffinose/stachyose/melibiose transport system permease protein [Marinilactibacillus psychrotolerans]SJN19862.1 Multiple sugar ABC transporter, membrane-spanning permease protein MsmG [Marinilactibacillus psychrotolerans 42ea]GEL67935.1 sugar ABC transporter permease [Marinilactibacillus psychrotolerans]GEQ34197.1 sugar A
MKKKKKSLYILEALGILLGMIWISPFYLMIVNSFKDPRGIFSNVLTPPSELNFENYQQAFEDLEFVRSFFNSLLITVASVLVIIIFSSMAGYALARNKSKLSSVLLLLFVAAMLIPFQSVMIPLTSNFGQIGMLNRLGLILMYLGFGCSLSIFLYHGAMTSISVTLDEAARMDGANKFQIFWKIIFPLLKPISVTVAILNVIWIWNDYLLPSLVLGNNSQTIPIRMFYFFGQYTKQWHLALAGLTIAIIPVIIFYFSSQKQIVEGVAEGALK